MATAQNRQEAWPCCLGQSACRVVQQHHQSPVCALVLSTCHPLSKILGVTF